MAIPPTRSAGDSGHIQDHNDIGTELAARLPLSGGTLTGALNGTSATFTGTVSAATPTSNSHLATKEYVDNNSASGAITGSGISKIFVTQASISPIFVVPFFAAQYPVGSVSYNEGWNDLNPNFGAGVTLPAGEFSSTPYMVMGESVTSTTDKVSGFGVSATSVLVSYTNFNGRPLSNTGFAIGPGPYTTYPSATVKLVIIGQ